MIDRFLYYCITVPVANMPLAGVYLLFDFFHLLIITLVPYRKKVVTENLQRSFPDLSTNEIKRIRRKFYSYFTDMFAESIRNLFIPEKYLRKRLVVRNPELMEDLYKRKRSVILLSSHYNNWEFLITAQSLLFPHKAIGIGAPLSNKYWDQKITQRRERFGMQVVHGTNYKQVMQKLDTPYCVLVLGDQSPGKSENCYWTKFLNQETAFYYGAEYMANEFDLAVVLGTIHRVRRGKYELELELVTNQPRLEPYGKITETYIRRLEQVIDDEPHYWLWSHKRWKKDVPQNLDEVKSAHRQRFIQKFRS